MITLTQLDKIAGKKVDRANAGSVLTALKLYGSRFGLDQPHRLAHYLTQLFHEGGAFRYDREIASGAAYEGRKDLGNTEKGDGVKFKGRTSIQITGRANTKAFYLWCKKLDSKCPDFVKNPELMNTDPWEGLGPIWYWSTRDLNRLADKNDIETLTKRINGGLNGYADRLQWYAKIGLVMLNYGISDKEIKRFQKDQKLEKIDGDAGPQTRSAIHVALAEGKMHKPEVKAAPVVETTTVEKPIAITPEQLDKPVTQTGGFRERITTLFGLLGTGVASWLGDWRVVLAITAALIVIVFLGLLLHNKIVSAVKTIKEAVEQ